PTAALARVRGLGGRRRPSGTRVVLVSVIVRVGSGRRSLPPDRAWARTTIDAGWCRRPLPNRSNGGTLGQGLTTRSGRAGRRGVAGGPTSPRSGLREPASATPGHTTGGLPSAQGSL